MILMNENYKDTLNELYEETVSLLNKQFDEINYVNSKYRNDKMEIEKKINEIEFRIEDIKRNKENSKSRLNKDNIVSLENENERLFSLIKSLEQMLSKTKKDKEMIEKQLEYFNEDLVWTPIVSGFSISNEYMNEKKLLEENLAKCNSEIKKYEKDIKINEVQISNNIRSIKEYEKAINEYQNYDNDLISLERNLAFNKKRLNDIKNSLSYLEKSPDYYKNKGDNLIDKEDSNQEVEETLEDFKKYKKVLEDKEVLDSKSSSGFNEKFIEYYTNLINHNKKEISHYKENANFYDTQYNNLADIIADKENDYNGITKLFEEDIQNIIKLINIETSQEKIVELNNQKQAIERDILIGQKEIYQLKEKLEEYLKKKNEALNKIETLRISNKEYQNVIDKKNHIGSLSQKASKQKNEEEIDLVELQKANEEQPIDVNMIKNINSQNDDLDIYIAPKLEQNKNDIVYEQIINDSYNGYLQNSWNIDNNGVLIPRNSQKEENITDDYIQDDNHNGYLQNSWDIDNNGVLIPRNSQKEENITDDYIQDDNHKEYLQNSWDIDNNGVLIPKKNKKEEKIIKSGVNNVTNKSVKLNLKQKIGSKVKAVYNASKKILSQAREKLEKSNDMQITKSKTKENEELIIKSIKKNVPVVEFREIYEICQKNEDYENLSSIEISKPGESLREALEKFKDKILDSEGSVKFVKLNTESISENSIISNELNIDLTSGDLYAIIPDSYYKKIMENRSYSYDTEMANRKK